MIHIEVLYIHDLNSVLKKFSEQDMPATQISKATIENLITPIVTIHQPSALFAFLFLRATHLSEHERKCGNQILGSKRKTRF